MNIRLNSTDECVVLSSPVTHPLKSITRHHVLCKELSSKCLFSRVETRFTRAHQSIRALSLIDLHLPLHPLPTVHEPESEFGCSRGAINGDGRWSTSSEDPVPMRTDRENKLVSACRTHTQKNSPRRTKADVRCVFDLAACLPDLIIRLLYLLLPVIVAAETAGLRRVRLACAWESGRGLVDYY